MSETVSGDDDSALFWSGRAEFMLGRRSGETQSSDPSPKPVAFRSSLDLEVTGAAGECDPSGTAIALDDYRIREIAFGWKPMWTFDGILTIGGTVGVGYDEVRFETVRGTAQGPNEVDWVGFHTALEAELSVTERLSAYSRVSTTIITTYESRRIEVGAKLDICSGFVFTLGYRWWDVAIDDVPFVVPIDLDLEMRGIVLGGTLRF